MLCEGKEKKERAGMRDWGMKGGREKRRWRRFLIAVFFLSLRRMIPLSRVGFLSSTSCMIYLRY